MTYETVVNYISTARTKTGLRVDVHLVRADYPTGTKVSDKEMKDLSVRHHDTSPTATTPSAPGDWLPESGKLFLRRPYGWHSL